MSNQTVWSGQLTTNDLKTFIYKIKLYSKFLATTKFKNILSDNLKENVRLFFILKFVLNRFRMYLESFSDVFRINLILIEIYTFILLITLRYIYIYLKSF